MPIPICGNLRQSADDPGISKGLDAAPNLAHITGVSPASSAVGSSPLPPANIPNDMNSRPLLACFASATFLVVSLLAGRMARAEVPDEGEKQKLIKITMAGGALGCNAARQLAAKYPNVAIDAIETGYRATLQNHIRGQFIEAAASIPGDAPLAFLRSHLAPTNGDFAAILAGKALFARGQLDCIPAMIDRWRKIQTGLPTDDVDAWSATGELISFLVRTGDIRAFESIEEEMQGAPVDVRLAILQAFLPATKNASCWPIGRSIHVSSDIKRPPDGEAGVILERLIMSALADTTRRFAMKGRYGEVSYEDPRICDLAALVLSQLWPERYTFRWVADAAECDSQILPIRIRWRKENGLPPLPPSTPIAIVPVKETDVAPLLDQFVVAPDDGARATLTTRIQETFGLRALPAVRSRLEDPKNEVFRPLIIHLASTVREVRFKPQAAGLADSIFTSLKGQALTGVRLRQLAAQLPSILPKDVRALTLLVERAADGTGFVMTIDCVPGKLPTQYGWEHEEAVRCGRQNLLGSFTYTRIDGQTYQNLETVFEKALQSGVDAPVTACIRIERSRLGSPSNPGGFNFNIGYQF